MGALLGVSQGSEEPPRVVVLKYTGKPGSPKMLAYVGKELRSIQAVSVLNRLMHGKDEIRHGRRCYSHGRSSNSCTISRASKTAWPSCPLAENMPSGRAQRPGDVVESMSGKTIEVINTDAEGR